MTPRGTTYVTVGSHGFYYRETLSNRSDTRSSHPAVPTLVDPQTRSPEGAIAGAWSSDLVESSSERLLQQLNERANLFNPAWMFYVAALLSLGGLAMLPDVPRLTMDLPNAAVSPWSTERIPRNIANNVDEYSALTARYGEPNSIVFTEADALAPVPVGTAQYNAGHVRVVFVPNACVNAYNQITKILAHRSPNPALAKRELKTVPQCLSSPKSGWTTVGYIDSIDDTAISASVATLWLCEMTKHETASPSVTLPATHGEQQRPVMPGLGRKQQPKIPEMRSNEQSRQAFEQRRQEVMSVEKQRQYSETALFLCALGLLVGGIVVDRKNTEKRRSRLFYELDEAGQQKHRLVEQAFSLLAKCHRIWRIEGESATADWKRNAGASSLVRRAPISVSNVCPPRVETNVAVPCVNLGASQLYFLPDTILYRDSRGYGSIAYSDFGLTQGFTQFIEDGNVPADAIIVDHTWRYVNKNGGPDRRFNNNRQLPILRLGVLVFASSKGLNVQVNTSNPDQSLGFADSWRNVFQNARRPEQPRAQQQPPRQENVPSSQESAARKILGVSETASAVEISAAYHRLAQLYHPDKVAGLATEFQALADRRMKEINAAYEAVKRDG